MVCRVEAKKNVTERIRLVTELDEDRGKQSAGILFFLVSEIEKKVGHVCCPSFGGAFDILDDRRTSEKSTVSVSSAESKPYRATYVSMLFPEPAMEPEVCE
jgi:hypothetical protein